MSVELEKIKEIQDILHEDLQAGRLPNEENTKLWYIMPFLRALGYSDRDIEAEEPAKFKGNKRIDLYIRVNGKAVMEIECKQRELDLNNPVFIKQLAEYFYDKVKADQVHIGVLTNGDDYWIFTDSVNQNIMDDTPYVKFKVSELKDTDILETLDRYSKDKITGLTDPKKLLLDVKLQKFKAESNRLATCLVKGSIPDYLIATIATESGIEDYTSEAEQFADILHKCVTNAFRNSTGSNEPARVESKASKEPKRSSKSRKPIQKQAALAEQAASTAITQSADNTGTAESLSDTQYTENKPNKPLRDKSRASNIKLNHEYTFDDYTDGDWNHHKLDYAVINNTKYEDCSIFRAYAETVKFVLDVTPDLAAQLTEKRSKRIAATGSVAEQALWKPVEGHSVSLYSKLDVTAIVKLIQFVLDEANLPHEIVKFSFKE